MNCNGLDPYSGRATWSRGCNGTRLRSRNRSLCCSALCRAQMLRYNRPASNQRGANNPGRCRWHPRAPGYRATRPGGWRRWQCVAGRHRLRKGGLPAAGGSCLWEQAALGSDMRCAQEVAMRLVHAPGTRTAVKTNMNDEGVCRQQSWRRRRTRVKKVDVASMVGLAVN